MDTDPVLPPPAGPPEPTQQAPPPPAPVFSLEVQRESPLRDTFFGQEGLYPGARWLIYLAMGFFVYLLEVGLMQAFRLQLGTIWMMTLGEVAFLVAAIVPGFAMAVLEGTSFGAFGLPARGAFRRNFWTGALWGLAWLTLLMVILRMAGAYEFGSLAEHGASILGFAAFYAVFFLFTGLFEEFALRGYSLWVLSRGMHFWPAAALLSVLFGAIHYGNSGEGVVGLVAAGMIGFFFCLTLRRTGNLWWAVGFHMSWDWGESYLYSVPDSGGVAPGHLLNSQFHGPDWLTGGTVGPEGSCLIFGLLVALWIVFDRLYPEVKYTER
jgi:membrane protease YdiL (CAAX protease family)